MKAKHIKAYLKCAEVWAECSDSTRTKVGAVLVKNNRIISCGYNALPSGMSGPLEDENGNTKIECRHAEQNALFGLVKSNESAQGATLFVSHNPCQRCSLDIFDSGIVAVYYKHDYRCDKGIKYLKEKGVIVYKLED
tara:strand:- start:8444 stop:8854 length:411 start_codon:yes stop_codon:yes gene_type:complete